MTWLIRLLLILQLLRVVAVGAKDFAPPLPPPSPLSVNPNFNPSTAIIMVCLVSAFFLLGFFSVYIRQCAATRFGGPGGFGVSPTIGGDGRRSRGVARGLDVTVLVTFPTFVYSYVKGLKIGKDVLECAVCLNEFEDDETLRFIPKCNHVFHSDCIDAWLAAHTTCPVCRADLVPKPGEINPVSTIHQPAFESEINESNLNELPTVVLVKSPESSLQSPSRQNRPNRAKSTGFRLTGLFPRSHTTGHSVGQVGENYDRFTLILPEEMRKEIMNTNLNRARSCVEFPRVRSTKRGFRSNSTGYERFNHDQNPASSSRKGLSISPSFLARFSSVKPANNVNGTKEEVVRLESSKSLLRSLKSPFDRLFLGTDKESNVGTNVGERSSDRLRQDSQV